MSATEKSPPTLIGSETPEATSLVVLALVTVLIFVAIL
jgi:hypothetical protein